ncbi:MAG: FAD-dependent monooxygenase [Thermomicrobiales bacterium]
MAKAESVDSGDELKIRANFLVGCDGGRSSVRSQLGAKLEGDAVIQRVQSTYLDAPELIELLSTEPAWGNLSLNPRRSGTVYAIDGRERWLIHNYLREDEADFDSVDRDWAIRTILGVGEDFEYRVISKEDWYGRRLLADKFRSGRAFICGDSAHLWVPYAGYGMNAGIADAENLGWLLAARIQGWGAPGILDAYEAERHPITEQVSRFAMDHAHSTARQRRAVPADIEDETTAGDRARRTLGQETYALNVQQYACAGLNFGYYYAESPIIAYDAEPHLPYTMADYTPSTVPGSRTPHAWLGDGTSLYDNLGPGYTLIRLDRDLDVGSLADASSIRNVPLDVLDVEPTDVGDPYVTKLVLSRPDRHVAWRGNSLPSDVGALVDLISGNH